MKIFLLSICFILTSFTANALSAPDLSLIKHWDQKYYTNHVYQPFPKVISYHHTHEGKKLTFVATKHKNWWASQQKIRTAIEQVKPQIILIEGIAQSDGISAKIWEEEIKQDLNREGYEVYYAYKLARERSIPFVGAELDGKMSDHTSYARDIAVVSRIADLLGQYNNVLVVYGAGHFVQQEDVLTKMLGLPLSVR